MVVLSYTEGDHKKSEKNSCDNLSKISHRIGEAQACDIFIVFRPTLYIK